MSVLKNPRHELYAQALAQGKTASEAIGLAGYTPDPRNSSRLTNSSDIRRRVDELLNMRAARQEKKADYDSRWVISELIDNVRLAKEKGDINASNNALKLLGSEKRMFRERVEAGNVGDFDALENIGEVLEKVAKDISPSAAKALAQALELEIVDEDTELHQAIPPTDAVN